MIAGTVVIMTVGRIPDCCGTVVVVPGFGPGTWSVVIGTFVMMMVSVPLPVIVVEPRVEPA